MSNLDPTAVVVDLHQPLHHHLRHRNQLVWFRNKLLLCNQHQKLNQRALLAKMLMMGSARNKQVTKNKQTERMSSLHHHRRHLHRHKRKLPPISCSRNHLVFKVSYFNYFDKNCLNHTITESEKEVESESIKPEEKEKSPEEELPPPPTPEQLQELDKSHGPKAQQSVESEAESKTETESESEANTVAEAPFEAQFEANFEADFDAKFDANFEPSPTPQTDPPADQKLSEAQTPNKSDQESDQEENTVHRKSSSDSSTSTELGVVNDEPLTDEDTEQLKNDEKKGEPKPKSDSEEEVDLK